MSARAQKATRGEALDTGRPAEPSKPLVFVTPLAHWSDLSRALMELHRSAGYCLARAMGGNEPTPEMLADLEQRAADLPELLARATRLAHGGAR